MSCTTGGKERRRAPKLRDEDEEEVHMFLELDQFARDRARPVPRAHLGARGEAALWALRVFALVVSAMVIYTFIVNLH